jgi:hypothetical protein
VGPIFTHFDLLDGVEQIGGTCVSSDNVARIGAANSIDSVDRIWDFAGSGEAFFFMRPAVL